MKLQRLKLSDFHIQTSGFVSFIMPLLNNLASISDLKIRFNELVILESFVAEDLMWQNARNYYLHQLKR